MNKTLYIGGTDATQALKEPPAIADNLNENCRTLTITVQQQKNPQALIGVLAELWVYGKRWFYGYIRKHRATDTGDTQYIAYDPMFNISRITDDFYFKQQTGTQIFTALMEKAKAPVGAVANTEYVFPQLYYPNTKIEKVCIDALARTKQANGRKFWFRFDPEEANVTLFERTVPSDIWVFKVGINLTSATKEDSAVNLFTSVKLVNRETGQTVIKSDDTTAETYNLYTQMFEEVTDSDVDMNARAAELMEQNAVLETTMKLEGINPNGVIPCLYKGDAIYVEEPNTGLIGGYYIRNVEQVVENDTLITLSMEIVIAPDLPELQAPDADKLTTDNGQTKES